MTELNIKRTVTYSGVLALRLHYQGSKSERLQPFLDPDSGESISVHVDGENPFEEPTLRGLQGSRVRLTGTMKRQTLVLSAEDIVILDDADNTSTVANEAQDETTKGEEFTPIKAAEDKVEPEDAKDTSEVSKPKERKD